MVGGAGSVYALPVPGGIDPMEVQQLWSGYQAPLILGAGLVGAERLPASRRCRPIHTRREEAGRGAVAGRVVAAA